MNIFREGFVPLREQPSLLQLAATGLIMLVVGLLAWEQQTNHHL